MIAKLPNPGIYYGIPYEEYDSWAAFRASYVAPILRSPRHYLHELTNPRSSDSMTFGALVDCLLTEPDEFDRRFAVRPTTYTHEVTRGRGSDKCTITEERPWTLQSNTCKAIEAAIQASGKTPINQADMERARSVRDAIESNQLMTKWMNTARMQVSMVWIDSETGVTCKGRLDMLAADGTAIMDTKTCRNADREPFRRDLSFYGYHVQLGLYQSGYAATHGGLNPSPYICAAESGEPFGVAVYPVGPDSLETGLIRARAAMTIWRDCSATGQYPSYPVHNDQIDILPYMIDPSVMEANFQ